FDTHSRLTGGDHNSGSDVYMRDFGRSGGSLGTRLISQHGGRSLGGNSVNGGVTAYAPTRGIGVFTTTQGPQTRMYYYNVHSGNIDDLAHASSSNGTGIHDVATSARANYVVFASTAHFDRDTNGHVQDVFLKFLTSS